MAQTGLILNEKSTSFEPEKMVLDPTTQTVQGRVQDIMKSDSPYVQQARTSAAQGMNAKGLLNTSMAIGEGEKAAYNAALPIASQDATAALTVGRENVAAENVARQAGAQAENQMGLQTLQGQQQMGLQELQGAQQKELANIEAQYKQTMQTNDSAARYFSQVSASMSEIMKEPGISVENKNSLIMQQTALLKSGLTVMQGISNTDLVGLLDFTDLDKWTEGQKAKTESGAVTAESQLIRDREELARLREAEKVRAQQASYG